MIHLTIKRDEYEFSCELSQREYAKIMHFLLEDSFTNDVSGKVQSTEKLESQDIRDENVSHNNVPS